MQIKIFKNVPRNVIVVAFVAFFSGFGQEMISPVLPAFILALGLDRTVIGLLDGLIQGTSYLFKFISGFLSDRFQNRKRFVFFGYALSSVARPLLTLVSNLPSLAALRAIDGVGKGVKDAPRDALVADSVAGEKTGRAFGFHRFIDTAGSVVGPLVAAALLFHFGGSLHGYRTIFALTALPGLFALLLITLGLKEPERRTTRKQNGNALHFPPIFWIFTITTFIAMFAKINDSLLLVRATDFGISKNWLPVLFAFFTLIYALLSYPVGILSDRYGKLPFITAGWFVLIIVHAGFITSGGVTKLLLLYALYGLFFALTEGSGRALIADLVPQESRGSAYAIFNTGTGLAVIFGGLLLGRVWDQVSAHAAFSISTFGSCIGFVGFLIITKLKFAKNAPENFTDKKSDSTA